MTNNPIVEQYLIEQGSKLLKYLSSTPHRGATFISPSGFYIWAKGEDHPSLVDLLGYEDTDEESIIDEKGWIRCDSGLSFSVNNLPASFIELPEKEITSEQYDALLNWMIKCCDGIEFQISCTNGDFKEYDIDYYGPEDLIKIIKYYYKQGILRESLVEDTRTALLGKSRTAGDYKRKDHGKNRFERKKYSKIANAVKAYNRIDMNKLFKEDTLIVNIPVIGETDNYTVSIKMEGIVAEIAKNIKNNNNKFEYRTIIQALTKIFNTANIYVKCTCDDYKYRFAHWNIINNVSVDDTSSDPGPGKGIRNPHDDKGRGCKHVLLVLANGDWMMKVASVINNYVHYAEEHLQKPFLKVIFPKLYGITADEMVEQNLIDDDKYLDSSTGLIDAINEYGRKRGQYKPGTNKNPVTGTGGRTKKEPEKVGKSPENKPGIAKPTAKPITKPEETEKTEGEPKENK